MPYCKICNEWNCQEHEFQVGKVSWKKEIQGSSPPEIFVGRWNYPNVYTGILAPEEYGNTELLSSHEKWHHLKLSIPEITSLRSRLIYGRTQQHIKHKPETAISGINNSKSITKVMQEVAMTHKSTATEMILKKPIQTEHKQDNSTPIISRAAQIQSAKLQENAPVKPKIDYLVNDSSVKSTHAIQELYNANIPASNIMKLLSAGLLGLKSSRKLVPTRWSITAVDSTLSNQKLEKIKFYQELSEIQLFNSNYLGNHYHFLLLPSMFSFEVIEISLGKGGVWQDYESNFSRKKYASSVTGAYYANRLALVEYLEKIKRQCACLVIREIRPEYNVPLGVGILRETSRESFAKTPQIFNTLKEAFNAIQNNLKQPIENYLSRSQLLKNYGKQSRLTEFF